MGRPRKQNPKNKYIGIATTEEKFRRFKALGLIGDEAIDVLLFHLENDKLRQNIEKSELIRRIKAINKEIEDLEFEKLKLETKLEDLNIEIGVVKTSGLNRNVDSALKTVMQRFNESFYPIEDFIKLNEDFIDNQAFLANIDVEDFKKMIIEFS